MIELRQHGKMWAEFDPVHLELKMRRGRIEARFKLSDYLNGTHPQAEQLPGDELPPLPPGEGVEAVKRIAALSPFRAE